MNQKIVFLILAAFLALLTWLNWYEQDIREEEKRQSEQSSRLFQWQTEDVSEISVHIHRENVRFILQKGPDAAWRVQADGVPAPASLPAIMKFLSAIRQFRLVRVISEDSSRLAEFGLSPPALSAELSFRPESATEPIRLSLGNPSPVGYGVYFTLDHRKGVLLGSRHIMLALNKQARDFRLSENTP